MQLPLASDRSRVTGVFHHRSKGLFSGIKLAEHRVIPNIIPSGHYLDATGSADRFGIALVELETGTRKLIQPWRFEVLAAIATDIVIGDIVRHDQDHVGFLHGFRFGEKLCGKNAGQYKQWKIS